MKRQKFIGLLAVILTASMLLSACNLPVSTPDPTEMAAAIAEAANSTMTAVALQGQTPEPTVLPPTEEVAPSVTQESAPSPTTTLDPTSITHTTIPNAPYNTGITITDNNTAPFGADKRAQGGEDYNKNLFERPFSGPDMVYRPDVDIQKAVMANDDTFYYVSVTVSGVNPDTGVIGSAFGVELDTDLDGRGDVLVLAKPLFEAGWTTATMMVLRDDNGDVGGPTILASDAPFTTNGYETVVFTLLSNSDPDAAWVRLSPGKANTVEIAFKKSLAPSSTGLMWRVWADGTGSETLAIQDVNDTMTSAEAGSPIYGVSNYPVKGLAMLDNTCRMSMGFTPTGREPGICTLYTGTATPTFTPTATMTATLPPPVVAIGWIAGIIYYDPNTNGTREASEPLETNSVPVTIRSGTCGSGGAVVSSFNAVGSFNSGGLFPGSYCVQISTGYSLSNPNPVNVTVTNGNTSNVLFGEKPIP